MHEMHENAPYIRLESDHDLRDLVTGLLSTCDKFTSSPFARARNIGLSAVESACLVMHRNGQLHVSHNGSFYRLRFWTREEYAMTTQASRSVVSSFDLDLDCWVGLEAAPHLTN